MAAVAITFARYVSGLTGQLTSDSALAVAALALLTLVNCFGVRSGSNAQSVLMILKILAIAALVAVGLWLAPASHELAVPAPGPSISTRAAGGAALPPVMFSYRGWPNPRFLGRQIRQPPPPLARPLL